MKKFYYQAYGLFLISDFKIDAFQEVVMFQSNRDSIELKQTKINFEGYSFIDDFVIREYTKDGFLYVIKDIVAFFVKDNCMQIQPLITDERVWQSFLVGGAMSILLAHNNHFLLHGSAIENARSAYLFLGDSGVGKSSLASSLALKNYNIITDDICALSQVNNVMCISLGTRQVRLLKDAVETLNIKGARYIKHPNAEPKFGHNFSNKSIQLKTKVEKIIELVVDPKMEEEIALEKVDSFQKIELLKANLYKEDLTKILKVTHQNFQFITHLANEVEFYRVNRRDRNFDLLLLTDFIEKNIIQNLKLKSS